MGMMNRKEFAKHKPGDKVKPKLHTGPGLTKQEFGDETNINTLVKKYGLGNLAATADLQPVFADLSEIGSFGDQLRRMTAGQEAFNALPAHVRSHFENDPVKMVEFLQDSTNREKAIELGLIAKPKAEPIPAPLPAPPAPTTPPAPPAPKA